MDKKAAIILTAFLGTISLTACTSQGQAPSGGVWASVAGAPESTAPSLAVSHSEGSVSSIVPEKFPLPSDPKTYQLLVEDIVERYKNNSVEINDMFPQLPEGFVFPDELPALTFQVNEMGYIIQTAPILDKSGAYEMYVGIDDTSYDGVKPEGNPHVHSVMFSKISC